MCPNEKKKKNQAVFWKAFVQSKIWTFKTSLIFILNSSLKMYSNSVLRMLKDKK